VLDQYRQLRKELDRLQPELAEQFAAEDRLLWDAEGHFPGGQLQLLAHEVDAGLNAYAALGKLEQYARLKVWIGRFRLFQAAHDRDSELTDDLQALGHRVFHQLKWLSRQYEPGYIEAFRQDYSTDWAAYVAEAQEQLVQAIESGRRGRDPEASRLRDRDREPVQSGDRSGAMGPSARAASVGLATTAVTSRPSSLQQLRIFLARTRLPEEGLDRFLGLLKEVVDELGPDDPQLVGLVYPFRKYVTGDDGLGDLRRNLEQIRQDRDSRESSSADDEAEDRDDDLDDGDGES